jgi:hypothetical protein
VTPPNVVSPRQQVIYDFDRQTVTVVTIYVNDPQKGTSVDIESIKLLFKVDKKAK